MLEIERKFLVDPAILWAEVAKKSGVDPALLVGNVNTQKSKFKFPYLNIRNKQYFLAQKGGVDKNKLPKLQDGQHIIQGYLSEQPQIRVRLITKGGIETAKMAYKTPAIGLVREEIEFVIPLKEAKELMAQTEIKLEKIRFLIDRWEIDVYEDKNHGLVVAEIELKSEDEEIGPLPAWIRHEVTGDKRYGNVTLAKKAIDRSLM